LGDLDYVEDKLIVAYVPPFNERLAFEVKKVVGAFA